MGSISHFPKYFLAPPVCPKNVFKCVKISPNLAIFSIKMVNFCMHFFYIFPRKIFLAPFSPKNVDAGAATEVRTLYWHLFHVVVSALSTHTSWRQEQAIRQIGPLLCTFFIFVLNFTGNRSSKPCTDFHLTKYPFTVKNVEINAARLLEYTEKY